jgi:hypothetical protein
MCRTTGIAVRIARGCGDNVDRWRAMKSGKALRVAAS